MEFTIQKELLQQVLGRVQGVADRKSSLAILSNILVDANQDGTLRLSATDLYLGISATTQAKVKDAGTLALSARTFFEIVRNLPAGEVTLKSDEGRSAVINSGRIRYKIPGMPGEDFPPLPDPGGASFFEIDADQLSDLIVLTQYSMSSDDTRPHLAGAFFEGGGTTLRMVTTDGHRLTKAERVQPQGSYDFNMLIPNKGVNELRRLLDDRTSDKAVAVAKLGPNCFFRKADVLLCIKLTEEKFVPYKKVIPSKHTRTIVLSRSALSGALKRISLVANDKSGGVRLSLNPGTLKITSENPDVGEGSEELEVDFSGDPLQIGFNARYMLDVLGALTSDQVQLELDGDRDPGVVRPVGDLPEFVGVIMPMRI